MSAQAEFFNPSKVPVKLLGPDHKPVVIPPNGHVILPAFFVKYTPTKLRFVKYVVGALTKTISKPRPPQPKQAITNSKPVVVAESKPRPKPSVPQPKMRPRTIMRSNRTWRHGRVGRPMTAGARNAYVQAVSESSVPVSNNIGIGILSYNRFPSLKRLVESIIATTDLKRTTLFISDESTNLTDEQIAWLQSLDACVLLKQPRLGIAGNTNRLLRCLRRFQYGIILNDDVEVLKPGWEQFYVDAMTKTGIQHFCFRELGVYGAKMDGVSTQVINGVRVETITEKPHGAILAFTKIALDEVGFFDEQFGIYGMEHVDWSARIARRFNTPGFHDVTGSTDFFIIHPEQSAVEDRTEHLAKAKAYYGTIGDRIKVDPHPRSAVPSISIVIPFRNSGRNDDLITVAANMRAQRFPDIEISIVEHSGHSEAPLKHLQPITYAHIKSDMQFNKSMAFNRGVLNAKHEKLILHDADIIVDGDYVADVHVTLMAHNSCHLGAFVYYLTEKSTNTLNNTAVLRSEYEIERVVTYFEGGSLGITKHGYKSIGGFDEAFVGYGVEDCAFYTNMSKLLSYKDDRKYKFFHLWHGRTEGWNECHVKNRAYYASVQQKFNSFRAYADYLVTKLGK